MASIARHSSPLLRATSGVAKTTLLRKLLDEVSDDVTIGLITNAHSAFGDPLKWVLLSFDLDYRAKSKVEQYQTLVDFLIGEYAQKRHTVLIVDEAQNLDDGALEELRMLSNINVDEHQILQLVLVGQPEFASISATAGTDPVCTTSVR